jgi:hypothetical protein
MNMELIHQIEQRALPELNWISNGLEAEFPENAENLISADDDRPSHSGCPGELPE